jgi:hypothetical protein
LTVKKFSQIFATGIANPIKLDDMPGNLKIVSVRQRLFHFFEKFNLLIHRIIIIDDLFTAVAYQVMMMSRFLGALYQLVAAASIPERSFAMLPFISRRLRFCCIALKLWVK